MVTFKDSALDLTLADSSAKGPWGLFLCLTCFGIPHHFAQAEATGSNELTHVPVTQFLKKTFHGEGEVLGSEHMVDGKVNSVSPVGCCSPFCLFH